MAKIHSSGLVEVKMEELWQQFSQHKVNSFVKWDLIRFLHDNPHSIETAENIAQVVCRHIDTVSEALDELVKSELLVMEFIAHQKVYRLSTDDKTRQLIKEFVAACHNREFRVFVINQIIREMSSHPKGAALSGQ